ncbi:MAG: hypothetical protein ABIT70_05685 [Sulfuriferula sp.]
MLGLLSKITPLYWLYIAAALAFAGVFGWGETMKMERNVARVQAAAEKTRADANTNAYLALAEVTKRQNAAVQTLKDETAAREAKAAQAAQEATRAAIPHQNKSAYYLGLKAPQSGVCDATKELINGYAKDRAHAVAGSVRH